ncbi:MAG: hypothetical protein OHK005_04790 [Candidatus Methylacidiphilales bacterium]
MAEEGDSKCSGFNRWIYCIPLIGILVLQATYALHFRAARGHDLYDPDCYMRLVRVERLVETGGWWDHREPRSYPPEGESSHWTRPLDVLLIAGAAPMAPWLGWHEALQTWGWWVSPALQIGSVLALWWAFADTFNGHGRMRIALLLLCQPAIFSTFAAGRPDHHSLILLCFILLVGFTRRAIRSGSNDMAWVRAGLCAGAGLWVSVELVAAVAVSGLACVWPYLVSGDRAALGRTARFFVAMAVMTVVFRLVERHPSEWVAVEYDVLSRVHLTAFVVAAGCLGFLRLIAGAWPSWGRWTAFLTASVAGLGLCLALYPGLLRGGLYGDVPPELFEYWMRYVNEVQPLLLWRQESLALAVGSLGPVLIAFPMLWVRWRRVPSDAAKTDALFQMALLVTFTGLSLWQVRWLAYAAFAFLPAYTLAMNDAVAWAESRVNGRWQPLVRVGIFGAFFSFVFLGGMLDPNRSPEKQGPSIDDSHGELAKWVGKQALPLDGRPQRVLSVPEIGPAILWHSRAEVMVTPYHRNVAGLLGSYKAFGTRDEEVFRNYLNKQGVTMVLVPKRWLRSLMEEGKMIRRLANGEAVAGLEQIELPPGPGRMWRAYQVKM